MRALSAIGAICALALAGCQSAPEKEAQVAPLVCPPPLEKPACPAPPVQPTPAPQPPVDYRGKLVAASWMDLPGWKRESVRPALDAFARSCTVLEKQDAWKSVCAGAQTLLAGASEAEIASFFEMNFDPHQVVNADDSTAGMVTGYYEPLLHGSRTRTTRYKYPLYGVPQDLLVIDLTSVYPDLKGRRLRGRIEGNKVVPYLARGDIDKDPAPLKGLEIAWVD
ncbi:MAG TPA: MltA domain-containing protein, partial [Usitatibacter sp.]|nr:MltA domain-containing protein [Usitatibacter sp.]